MRVLVTGANGFVAAGLIPRLLRDDVAVRAAVRRVDASVAAGAERVVVGDLGPTTDWSTAVRDVDVVVHVAARVHIMHDTASDPLAEFRRVNVEGTIRLARTAAQAGVRRLVFLSSIKVNGEQTDDRPFRASDTPAPTDPYGISKLEAERALLSLGQETGMEVVIIRPVLVYGPGVKANFAAMMRWVRRGVPLPLGAISNRRSLVARTNLVDLIAIATRHPAAANQVFLVSDGEDLSVSELLRRMARASGVRSRLIPVPQFLLALGARLVGRSDMAQRLFGSLQVDIQHTRETLGWSPVIGVDEALAETAGASPP